MRGTVRIDRTTSLTFHLDNVNQRSPLRAKHLNRRLVRTCCPNLSETSSMRRGVLETLGWATMRFMATGNWQSADYHIETEWLGGADADPGAQRDPKQCLGGRSIVVRLQKLGSWGTRVSGSPSLIDALVGDETLE